jgi:hypothetical protein
MERMAAVHDRQSGAPLAATNEKLGGSELQPA